LPKRITILLACLIFLFLPVTAAQAVAKIDKSRISDGVISVEYGSLKNVVTKVMISKEGVNYIYNLNVNSSFPLQLGDGKYTVSVLENVAGNSYRVVKRKNITTNLADENAVFLQSIQLIDWHEDMEVIKKAKELTVEAKTDLDKLAVIYNYIVNNISYDYQKYNQLNADYIPAIEEINKTKQGICYDYAALTAAMLRSVGVPTKLVMGYKNDITEYHAWNQVYMQDSNAWVTIDTTYDSILKQNDIPTTMLKTAQEYFVDKQY
jgi:transglutaminase-like putative cysteine protease